MMEYTMVKMHGVTQSYQADENPGLVHRLNRVLVSSKEAYGLLVRDSKFHQGASTHLKSEV